MVQFFQTPMGRKYYEIQLPALIKQITALNGNLSCLKKMGNIEDNLEAIEANTTEIVHVLNEKLTKLIEKLTKLDPNRD